MLKVQISMFEADTKIFNQEMLQKLLKLSTKYQAQLISRVRKIREERTKEELQIITEKENKLKQSFQNPNLVHYAESSYQYEPRPTLDHKIRHKLLKCLHYQYFKTQKDQMCVICHIEFQVGCKMVMLGCSHHYHIKCIQNWFTNTIVCPLCKDTVIMSNEAERIKEIQGQMKQLSVSRAAIVSRNKNTNGLLQSVFLSKLRQFQMEFE